MSIRRKDDGVLRVRIDVQRRASAQDEPYWQRIPFETEEQGMTLAGALNVINSGGYADDHGQPVEPIRWECGCLQKKCGACAMVIDGRPRLACDCTLREFRKAGKMKVEPLHKFPPVADLMVDRSILFDNLKTLKLWAEENVNLKDGDVEDVYDASRCLQCGCCLEVCPNFYPGGDFFGAAGFVPTSRLLYAEQDEDLKASYRQHAYAGCGKSLSCAKICPAGIDIEHLLIRSNAIAWMKKR